MVRGLLTLLIALSDRDNAVSEPPGAAEDASPARPLPSTNGQEAAPLTSREASQGVKRERDEASAAPTEGAKRKREKVEYVPLTRYTETVAGWDLNYIDEGHMHVAGRRRERNATDLGTVDIHSVVMSLRSRLAAEVSYSLNTLMLISLVVKTAPTDSHTIIFNLKSCPALVDELLELLHEVVLGESDEADEDEIKPAPVSSVRAPTVRFATEPELLSDKAQGERKAAPPTPPTYRELFQLASQDELELRESERSSPLDRMRGARGSYSKATELGFCPLPRAAMLSSIVTILRNIALNDENAKTLAEWPGFLELLMRIVDLALLQGSEPDPSDKLALSAVDLLAIRKDVLHLVNAMGLDLRLDKVPTRVSKSVFDLLYFFLADVDLIREPFYLDLSSYIASGRAPGPSVGRSQSVDVALAAFARVGVRDANRAVIARVTTDEQLFSLFERLMRLAPMSAGEFTLLSHEGSLVTTENLAMSLYNIVFLAPTSTKLRIRLVPAFTRSLLRVVRRLGSARDKVAHQYTALLQRCLEVLVLLNEVGGMASKQDVAGEPWYGRGMCPLDDDELEAAAGGSGGDKQQRSTLRRSANPTQADRATVKAIKPQLDRRIGLAPVLAGEMRSLTEVAFVNPVLYRQLVVLADGRSATTTASS